MWSLKQNAYVFLIALLSVAIGRPATAAPPEQALDAYVKAYTQMGKAAALIFNHSNTQANARAKMITTQVDAQCKLLSARAAWVTAVANVSATNAKTLETLEQVRSQSLDNSLKVAKTFYEKRTLHEGSQGSNTRKRPTQEDLTRYSRAAAPNQPSNVQLEPVRGKIYWPEVFLQEEFSDGRIQLDCLFAVRKATHSVSGSDISHQVQSVAGQMREQLRSQVRQMSPAEYVAARKFLDSLAYEARFPAQIEGLASN